MEFYEIANAEGKKNTSLIHLAVNSGCQVTFKLIFEDENLMAKSDSLAKKLFNQQILKESISGNSEALETLLNANVLEAENSPRNEHGENPCHLAAKQGHVKILQLVLNKYSFLAHQVDNKRNTPLHTVAETSNTKCLEIILQYLTCYDKKNKADKTPLDCALDSGLSDNVEILLKKQPLDKSFVERQGIFHAACKSGHHEVVKLLIENNHYVDSPHDKFEGLTPLQVAIKWRRQTVINALIESAKWKSELNKVDPKNRSTLCSLIKHYPELAEKVFDRFIEKDDKKEILTYHIHFIENLFWTGGNQETEGNILQRILCLDDSSKRYSYHPMQMLVTKKHKDLLMHPLCLLWLRLMWIPIGRSIFMFESLLFFFYLMSLTAYCVNELGEHNYKLAYNSTLDHDKMGLETPTFSIWITILFTGMCYLYELYQLVTLRLNYFRLENVFDLLLYSATVFLIAAPDMDFHKDMCTSTQCWKWPFGAVLLMVAWLNSLRYLKFFSLFGIFLLMFQKVLKNVVKLGIVLAVFIFAFSLSFKLTLMNHPTFGSFSWSFLKTLVMSTGEFEYGAIFQEDLPFPQITIITFIALVMLMTIVLMNMLIGLAVDDINKIRDEAELEGIISQIRLALNMRKRMFVFFDMNAKKQIKDKVSYLRLSKPDKIYKTWVSAKIWRYLKDKENTREFLTYMKEIFTTRYMISEDKIWKIYKTRMEEKEKKNQPI